MEQLGVAHLVYFRRGNEGSPDNVSRNKKHAA